MQDPHHRPEAIITINDITALGVLRAAIELNLRVPRDISIAGYDDVIFAAIAEVPLTTVRQPMREIGRKSVEILIDRIEGQENREEPYAQVLLKPKLVVRKSCRDRRTKEVIRP